ncbi:MAG TPA: cell division protein FtsZ [Desulfosalsimonadaceae bacterium]|nr:cell division protein FtsZ [Desulfosalsimonadaceae bacterium]
MNFTYVENNNAAKIKVIGVGGGGNNAIDNMIDANLEGVKFIAANTDAQALAKAKANTKIQLGEELTQGLGAGADPNVGREAAVESTELLREALADSHMVFIAAGLGGGTGTGAAPIIAELCKEMGALTVAVVTKPFTFEAKKRSRYADEGIAKLREVADTVITIPNDRLRGLASKKATLIEMFKKADEILHHCVKGITDLIMNPGLINLDFADVKTTMSKAGMAIMGIGVASGENRALEAAERAISHPLLEDNSIVGARGVLMNITCNSDLTMEETMEASDRIYNEINNEDVELIWGTAVDDSLGDEMRVTVIATGIGDRDMQEVKDKVHKFPAEGFQPRGKVRDLTEEDMKMDDYDIPTVIRNEAKKQKSASSSGSRSGYGGRQARKAGREEPGGSNSNYDTDLDIPTFLRRKAD